MICFFLIIACGSFFHNLQKGVLCVDERISFSWCDKITYSQSLSSFENPPFYNQFHPNN